MSAHERSLYLLCYFLGVYIYVLSYFGPVVRTIWIEYGVMLRRMNGACPRLYFNGNFLTNSHSDRTATSIHVRHDSHIFVE